MAHARFSYHEMKLIFQLSEAGGGHAGERHVGISRNDLNDRIAEVEAGGFALRTAFLSFDDQIGAAMGMLNRHSPDVTRFLDDLARAGPNTRVPPLKCAPLAAPVVGRYARPGGGKASMPFEHATLIVRKRGNRPRGMHIVTFFPALPGF